MLRVFLVFLSLRLSFALPAALRSPHCAASSRSVSWGRQGENRRSVSLAGKPPPLSRRGPARRVRLHLIDADVYVGTASWGGEVLFRFAPLIFFSPYSILLGGVRSPCVQLHRRGVGVVNSPLRAMPLCHRNEGCYLPRKPRYPPPSAASLRRNGELGRGGSFSFRPLCLLFPLFYICLAACATIVCNCTRGVLALCVQNFVGTSVFRRPLERSRRGQRAGGLRDGKKRGRKCTETGCFLHRLPSFALESGARRVPSNRVVVVRGRAQTVPAANETNAGQKRNL